MMIGGIICVDAGVKNHMKQWDWVAIEWVGAGDTTL